MKHKLTSTVLFSILFTFACSNSEPKKKAIVEAKTEVKEVVEESTELQLNEGEKWKANPETTKGVENMIAYMDAFTDADNISAYHELNDSIKSEFTGIFQKCTMKGEAHNQLHNFLIPIKDQFDALGSNNLDSCKAGIIHLKDHLRIYFNFFE